MAESTQHHDPPPPYCKESTIYVFLAGRSGAGKSTLMREVFDFQDIQGQMSAERGTLECATREKTKNGITFIITDTVGLHAGAEGGSAGRQEELRKLSAHLKKLNGGKNDLLLYTLPVDVSSRFNNGNPAIMKSLQFAFGKDIWKKCVLVLTFSNNALERFLKTSGSDAAIKYNAHITKYATKFQEELKKLGNDMPVKVAFTQIQQQPPPALGEKPTPQIVAIPAGEVNKDVVYPDLSEYCWKDVFIHNLVTSTNCELSVKERLLYFQYGETAKKLVAAIAGGGVGGGAAAAGAYFGVFMGILGGPVGTIAAAVGGAAVGYCSARYHSAKNM